ncbi:Chromosome partition protein Smc [Frondihabitans sp. 762G35]|uniref:YhgE/Pip domain-containing protein n=1 Tax=Frondihabitans sp. 762G35 TaxID=1446794 RepID=UPI000D217396|nr:YhgE/Pip domain-containing protein [Frondihabitans sp. 762G35]ARC58223.1 Chromosome partition protein Smc [Frondihabitans sp. 762G35]
MKIIALIRSELKRLTATSLARLALVALMTVPLLYGGMYLWANQNPYAKLDHIPAAIVNTDTGAKDAQGHTVNYGDRVTKQLVDGKDFDWHVVSAAQASKGITDETYNFVFTIPSGFSEDLTSASTNDPSAAKIDLTTNDTTSYLSSTIADQAGKTIRATVTQEVSKQAASTLLVGLSTVRDDLGTAAMGSQQLVDGSTKLASGLDTAKAGATSLLSGASQVSTGASTLNTGLQTLKSQTSALPSQTRALADGADQLRSQTTALPGQTKALATGLDTLRSGTATLPADAQRLSTGANDLATGTGAYAAAVHKAAVAAAATQATLPQDAAARLTAAGFTPAQITLFLGGSPTLTALDGQTGKLVAGSAQVAAGAATLNSSAPTLAAGISQAAGGADQLAAKTPALTSGIAQVAAGNDLLAAKTPALASGIAQAAAGSAALSSGAAQTASGASTLASGVSQLDSGARQLVTGSTKLTTGLKDGVTKIPATTSATRDKQAAAIADPVTITDSSVASAGSYGAGLAPFFISLAAWIGMYALFLIIKPISKRALTAVRAPGRITMAGWLTPAALGLVQMLALFAIVKFVLGFDVVHPGPMIALMVLASITFAAIIMTLNVWLGSVGQFLGLVLMLIQLVTAGGTFPWQTLPGPLAALHFALPMSYAVDGLRQLMYGGSLGAAWQDAGILALWLLGALLLSFVAAARMTRRRTLRDLRPSLIG